MEGTINICQELTARGVGWNESFDPWRCIRQGYWSLGLDIILQYFTFSSHCTHSHFQIIYLIIHCLSLGGQLPAEL